MKKQGKRGLGMMESHPFCSKIQFYATTSTFWWRQVPQRCSTCSKVKGPTDPFSTRKEGCSDSVFTVSCLSEFRVRYGLLLFSNRVLRPEIINRVQERVGKFLCAPSNRGKCHRGVDGRHNSPTFKGRGRRNRNSHGGGVGFRS